VARAFRHPTLNGRLPCGLGDKKKCQRSTLPCPMHTIDGGCLLQVVFSGSFSSKTRITCQRRRHEPTSEWQGAFFMKSTIRIRSPAYPTAHLSSNSWLLRSDSPSPHLCIPNLDANTNSKLANDDIDVSIEMESRSGSRSQEVRIHLLVLELYTPQQDGRELQQSYG
jgi:hypothetical protein